MVASDFPPFLWFFLEESKKNKRSNTRNVRTSYLSILRKSQKPQPTLKVKATTMNDDQLRWITAMHEAGHAAMRWMLELPATNIYVSDGDGYCDGTEVRISGEQSILIALAGEAAETDYGTRFVDFSKSPCEDFDDAREVLSREFWLRLRPPDTQRDAELLEIDEALNIWFDRCCEMLQPHCSLIENIATAAVDGYLSAQDLSFILEQYEKGFSEET